MKRLSTILIALALVAALSTSAWALGERVQVTMKDGNVFQGVLVTEADEYVELRVGANEIRLMRASIQELRLLAESSPERQLDDVSPIRAMWSSLIVPGFGQFLNGEVSKGFLHLGVAIGLGINLGMGYQRCTAAPPSSGCEQLGSLAPAFVPYMAWAFYSAADGYVTAEELLQE